jgi:hypothetical protein
MDQIRAEKPAYFIKLGKGGRWEKSCIENGTIRLGFHKPSALHSECLNGEWSKVYDYWIEQGKSKGKATEIKNQIKAFYESDEETLWITFFKRRMHWCFAEKKSHATV